MGASFFYFGLKCYLEVLGAIPGCLLPQFQLRWFQWRWFLLWPFQVGSCALLWSLATPAIAVTRVSVSHPLAASKFQAIIRIHSRAGGSPYRPTAPGTPGGYPQGPPGQTQNLKNAYFLQSKQKKKKFLASVRRTLGFNQLCFHFDAFLCGW